LKLVRFGVGISMAILTDIAFGALVVHLFGKVFLLNITTYFYLIGMFLALLPDIDTPIMWLYKHGHFSIHRLGTHYPLIIIPVICLPLIILSVIWPILGYWALVAFICLLFHYIHDSIGKEVGEKWLWPIDKKNYYKFFIKKNGKRRIVVALNEKEIKVRSIEEWLKDSLRPTPTSIIGVVIVIVVILIIAFW